jgi:23S rRNA-/tRNA-specific pseudouridylate synthase
VGDEVYAQHIHRLDRPVSGVVIFAKQRAVLKNLSEQFAERSVKKIL